MVVADRFATCGWERPHVVPTLDDHEAHVWSVPLDLAVCIPAECWQWLTVEEQTRALRFRFERDRQRFVMARIALRTILSAYVRCHPRQLVFGQNAFGKPYLSLLIPHYLQFNQSHSADQLLCVVSHTHAVGIDIERIDRSIAISALAPMLFSAPEQALFDTLPPARQHEYLFANWTRKEALVKALGTGISTPLPSIAIQPGLDQAQQLVETGDRAMFPRHWSVYDLAVMPEYAAAVVIEGTDCRPRPLMWAWQDLTPYLAGASTL